MKRHERELHDAGQAARKRGAPKRPPMLSWAERHWWLVGWNQEDLDRKSDSRRSAA